LSFYEGVGVRDLKIEEWEVLCTESTALVYIKSEVSHDFPPSPHTSEHQRVSKAGINRKKGYLVAQW
jgi:hypothetical protein